MKSIKKSNHSFWLIGSFVLIVLIFLLILSRTPEVITKDTIGYEEVLTLIQALGEEDKSQYEALLTKYTDEEGTSQTTYLMLKETLDTLDSTGNTSAKILDNVSINSVIDRDEFFNLYEQLLDDFQKREEITLEEISVLGISKEQSESGESLLITTNETGSCKETLFLEYAGFVTKTYVKRVNQEVTFLVVKEASDEEINLPYMYVQGQDTEGIHFLVKNKEVVLPSKKKTEISNDTVASLVICQGQITKIKSYDEKMNDKVLSINDTYVTLENYGVYEFCDNMKVYKVYEGLSEGSIQDVALGYEFVDFVLEDGKICACLIVASEGMEYIRVLIKTTDFLSNYHNEVTMSCDSSFKVYENGEDYTEYAAYEEVTFSNENLEDGKMVKIVPDVLSGKVILSSIKRNQGTPSYSGIMELHQKEEGIVVINEVLLEEYLYTVVPSEMPSYYQEQALMAQAICARTYAYTKMKNAGLKELGAHLDDSTSFQVYNNINEQVSTTSAVRETSGIILTKDNVPIETLYYSTSFGIGSTGLRLNHQETEKIDLSTNDAFDKYIENTYESDFEVEEGFYRWNYETNLDTDILEKRLEECYNKNKNYVLYFNQQQTFDSIDAYEDLGEIKAISVVERSVGGRAEKITIQGSNNTIMLIGEYNIRYTLLNEENMVNKQDGTTMTMTTLLPSAFFKIETRKEGKAVVGYSLIGGGFGHGNGMSQNGAGNMAQAGYKYTDILQLFYESCTLEQIY